LEGRRGDQHQRLRVVGESLAAAVRTLQIAEQLVDDVEIVVRVPAVPDAQREQPEEIHEVVIEDDRKNRAIHRLSASLVRDVIEDVDRYRILIDYVGFAVPVVQGVKTVLSGEAVVAFAEAVERDLVS